MKPRILSLVIAFVLSISLSTPALASGAGTANSPTAVSAGNDFAGLIDKNGSLWMWGNNEQGRLGNGGFGNVQTKGGFVYQAIPIKVMDNVVSISCGVSQTAVIKTDGSLWMWGYFDDSKRESVLTPVKVMDNVIAVSCGREYTAAIKTDGSLWMWGRNQHGQLGTGIPKDEAAPVKIMDNVAYVSCSSWGHTAAIKTDGSLWMWGENGRGQLGNGGGGDTAWSQDAVVQSVPVKVMANVASVSCGYTHTAAVKADGSLWAWGYNGEGQLGNGRKYNTDNGPFDRFYQTVPVKIMDGVSFVSCDSHTAAIKTDGSLWVWGDNTAGKLGNGYVGDRTNNDGHGDYPVQTVPIKLMDNAAAVSCGSLQTYIVKTDGSVWACGRTEWGELGNGGASNGVDNYGYAMQTTPVQLSGLTARAELPTAFYDVAASTYYTDPVIWAVGKGITNGTSTTTFSPDKTCTTGEILTFLWKARNSPEPTINNPFSDVAESSYYYKAALWAYEKGLVSGSVFGANAPCTRSITVVYLWKLAGSPATDGNSFTDIPSGADYSVAVSWAVSKGITSGTDNNTFSPDSTCTRGQIATFLYRAFVE